jgi:MoxR-like ATPase
MSEVDIIDDSFEEAPPYTPIGKLRDPRRYVPDDDTKRAVDVAVLLGLPLLVTGDPGSGKTQLAFWVAHRYGRDEPILFHAKTSSTAQDLFYRYDSLGHFHASNFGKTGSPRPDVMEFIHPQGLGLAILRALDPSHLKPFLTLADDVHDRPRRRVVLIDEIDKAPRDFPNDVLDEIENMTFTVREAGLRVPARGQIVDEQFRPIVILTSNSERNLPDAFLRRCAYLDIGRPGKKQLQTIVEKRLDLDPDFFTPAKVGEAIDFFMKIRESGGLKKRPATDEFLKWLHMLNKKKLDVASVTAADRDALFITCAILAKSREDEKRLKSLMEKR